MPTLNQRTERAQRARANGAKSHGPKTPEGMQRSQSASYKHGLYATRGHMLPGESNDEFLELKAQQYAYWQPNGFQPELLVNELVGYLWEAKRMVAAKNDHLHDLLITVTNNAPNCPDQAKLNLDAEKLGVQSVNGTIDRCNARLAFYNRERDRVIRLLLRLEKRSCTSGPSQMSLEINRRQNSDLPQTSDAQPVEGTLAEAPYIVEATNDPLPESFPAKPDPEPAPEPEPEPKPEEITAWAAQNLDFKADAIQEQILTETNTRILVLGPRQAGKSTAAAVRVLHEAVHKPDALILLASASGRQSGQILEKTRQMARHMDLDLFAAPPKCEGFTLANGAKVVALPDNEEKIRCFSAPSLIVVDEAAFASDTLFSALEPMLSVSNGTLMVLSTPNGQTGYFYEKWHQQDSPWTRILGTLEDCPRISDEAITKLRESMSEETFQQEFDCQFIAAGGQYISLETFRKCLRDDFDLFAPDWERSL
jgi:hypothetical protein